MGDKNEDNKIDEETYKKYGELRDKQQGFQLLVSGLFTRVQSFSKNTRTEAEEVLGKLVTAWPEVKSLHAQLKELNKEGVLNNLSYFKESRFDIVKSMVDVSKKRIFKLFPDEQDFLNLSSSSQDFEDDFEAGSDIDDSADSERMQSMQKELSELKKVVTRGSSSNNREELLLRYLQHVDADNNFPEFPALESEYRVWRKKVRTWEARSPNIPSEIKIDFLLKAINKNSNARSIVKCFDSSVGSNYDQMLKALDEQFFTARQTVYNHFMGLVNPNIKATKGSEYLQEVFNKFSFEWKNFESFTSELMSEDQHDNELEKLKFQINVIKNALLFNLLDEGTKNKVVLHLKITPDKIPDFEDVLEYVKIMFLNVRGTRELILPAGSKVREPTKASNCKKIDIRNKKAISCTICPEGHKTVKCPKFLAMTPQQRQNAIKKKGQCFVCLYRKYRDCNCATKDDCRKCKECGSKHHILLHMINENSETSSNKKVQVEQKGVYFNPETFDWAEEAINAPEFSVGTKKLDASHAVAVLPTAVVKCTSEDGMKSVEARVLFDTGADQPLITYEFAKRLGLKLKPTFIKTYDYQGKETMPVRHETNVTMNSLHEKYSLNITAYLRKSLGGVKPIPEKLRQIVKAPLADTSNKLTGGRIDIIMPVKYVAKIRKDGMIRISEDLILENTRFGYMALGCLENSVNVRSLHTRMVSVGDPEFRAIGRFFDQDTSEPCGDEELAEQMFMKYFSRLRNGKMVVGMPLLEDQGLGESKRVCIFRTHRVMNQLSPEMRVEYIRQFEDLMVKSYIRPADTSVPGKYYVSHLPVINKDSLTHPLRIVFDSSQKTSNGKSLNDIQLKGKKLQNSLQLVLIGSRIFEGMNSTDLSKMYLSMDMIDKHIPYQRTFMPTKDGKLMEVEMPTIIFGNTSSPFLAIRAMQELASLENRRFPLAADIIRDAMYVDDVLYSLPVGELMKEASRQLQGIAESAQLKFRKWASNVPEAIEMIPEEDKLIAIEKEIRDDEVSGKAGILGLSWLIDSDELSIKMNKFRQLKEGEPLTLRFALSQIATVYDAIGLLSPLFLTGRLIIKEIYKELLDNKPLKKRDKRLDISLSEELRKLWCVWSEDLCAINDLKTSRWIRHVPGNRLSIIAFADASLDGTGSTIYSHSEGEGEIHVNLLMAKSNIKPSGGNWTIPKLELKAMEKTVELAMDVKNAVQKTLKRGNCDQEVEVYFFSDSEITLAWLQGNPNDRATFVRNRLNNIKKVCSKGNYYYIDTKLNPADLASRKCKAGDLIDNPLWWHGPSFLTEKGALGKLEERLYETIVENRSKPKETEARVAKVSHEISVDAIIEIANKISGWVGTLKRIGWLRRTVVCFKTPGTRHKDLSGMELEEAKWAIIRAYQRQAYNTELDTLSNGKDIKTGLLVGKCAFIDDNGVLRIRSRLQNVKPLEWSQVCPIVLPKLNIDPKTSDEDFNKVCPLTMKLILYFHLEVMHGGVDKVLAALNQEFYLPNGTRTVKSMIYRCVKCRMHKKQVQHQLMGSIPMENVTPSPPFYHVSCDAFGPLQIKHQPGKRTRLNADGEERPGGKAWGIIFVCRATRGVHIEVASSLSAEEFLMCFRNFVATRGLPRSVLTDNGTNFKKGGDMCVSLTSAELTKQLRAACKSKKANANAAKVINKYLRRDSEMESMQEAIDYVESKYKGQQVIFLKGKGDLLKFSLSPCYSPWFNGLAESEVKVVKSHLVKIIRTVLLNAAGLHSVLKRIEAVINSKPIAVTKSDDNSRPLVITPAHFWASRPLVALPSGPIPKTNGQAVELTKRAIMMDQLVEKCWEVVQNKHFNELKSRHKWFKRVENPQVGEVVLLKDKNSSVNCWPKAVITKIHPGKDKIVRVVTVKNSLGHTHERAMTEVVTLPIIANIQSNKNNEATDKIDQKLIKKQENKVEQPKRQSARLAARNSSKTLTFSLLKFIVLISFVPIVLGRVLIPQKAFGGAMVFDIATTWRKAGDIKWEVSTGMYPQQDHETIKRAMNSYEVQCNRASGFSKSICTANLDVLRASSDNVKRLIGEFKQPEKSERRSRSKRSTDNEGIVTHLWRLLFGYHQNKPSYEAIQHLSKAQELANKHQKSIEEKVNSQLLILTDAVNEYEATWDNRDAELKQALQFQHVHSLINEHFEYIFEKYTEAIITNEEIQTMIGKLKADQIHVPNIRLEQWREMFDIKIVLKNSQIIYEVVWPILHEDTLKVFKVIPTPTVDGQILDFEPQIVIMNPVTSMYVKEFRLINQINVTHQVIEASRLMKLSKKSACPVAITMNEMSISCVYKKLPEEYDYWVKVIPNVYCFDSNVQKEKICHPNSRTKIDGITGTVILEQKCFISTTFNQIDYLEDHQESGNVSSFHIPELSWNVSESTTPHKTILIDSLVNQDAKEIQEEIDLGIEANIPERKEDDLTTLLFAVLGTIVAIVLITLIGICCWKRREAVTAVNIKMEPVAPNTDHPPIRTPKPSPKRK